jgi:hypothetical protein
VEHSSKILDLVELILKRRERLDLLIRERALQAKLIPRLLAIALAGFVLFGVAQSLVLGAAGVWPRLTALTDVVGGDFSWPLTFAAAGQGETLLGRWLDGSALALLAAYALGLIAASGICLPSLYFYGLLVGVRMSMLDVVLHTLKAKATAAVALIGILPIYAAVALGVAILPAPAVVREASYWLGLSLPFLAGLWGTWSLYLGFVGLADTLPDGCRGRRTCFLRRLVVAWSACYTAVTPVLIFTLWRQLS